MGTIIGITDNGKLVFRKRKFHNAASVHMVNAWHVGTILFSNLAKNHKASKLILIHVVL